MEAHVTSSFRVGQFAPLCCPARDYKLQRFTIQSITTTYSGTGIDSCRSNGSKTYEEGKPASTLVAQLDLIDADGCMQVTKKCDTFTKCV